MILPSKSDTTHVETHFDNTGRAEAESFLSEIEGDGAKAGEVFAEVAAKAESANTSAGELAVRIKRLEERQTVENDTVARTDGSGWVAVKRGSVAQVTVNGASAGFELPVGFRPVELQRATMWGDGGVVGRVIVRPGGAVSFHDALAGGGRVFGGLTFVV